MGAEFNTLYLKTKDKTEVKKRFKIAQENDLHENGHSYSGGFGMATGLDFLNDEFTNYDIAEEFLINKAKKWDNALAVKVIENGEVNYLIGAWCSS